MTEDIVVFEMYVGHCRLLKACNDGRHGRLRNVDEGHCCLLKACNDGRHGVLQNANDNMTFFVSTCYLTRLSWDSRENFSGLSRQTLSLRQRKQPTVFVSTCYQTWLSLDSKRNCNKPKKRMTIIIPAYHRTRLSLDGKKDLIVLVERHWVFNEKIQMITLVPACQWARLPLVDGWETLIVLVERQWVFDKGCKWTY